MLSHEEKSLAEFRALFKKETGRDITAAQAAEYEERLVQLVKYLLDFEREKKERAPP